MLCVIIAGVKAITTQDKVIITKEKVKLLIFSAIGSLGIISGASGLSLGIVFYFERSALKENITIFASMFVIGVPLALIGTLLSEKESWEKLQKFVIKRTKPKESGELSDTEE